MAAVACAQLCVRPFAAKASRPVAQRSVRLVVRAQQDARKAVSAVELPAFVKPAAMAAVANVLMAMPAYAEAGKIFDFNLTLPIMAGQFLLLMVFLEKTWFTPVGKLLDERDELIRGKLASVSGNSNELAELQARAEAVLKEARQEAQDMIAKAKAEVKAEQEKELATLKTKIDAELKEALGVLEKEEKEALDNLDAQVTKLSQEIIARVLPDGVSLTPAEAS